VPAARPGVAGMARGPEDQAAHGVGAQVAGIGQSRFHQALRALGVGGEEEVEGGAVADLGIELARGGAAEEDAVPAPLLEACGQLVGGVEEVGGHRHPRLAGRGGSGGEERRQQAEEQVEGTDHGVQQPSRQSVSW
jgi:hypothetical protein